MLEIEIVHGKRKGLIFNLLDSSVALETPIAVQEDEVLVFRATIDEDIPTLSLVLHENEVLFTSRFFVDGCWVYEWHPKETYGRKKEAFFHNYYGLAELSIAAKDPDDPSRFLFVLNMQPLEVLAKKINADRVTSMLEFLSRHDGRDLASAIRITRLRAGFTEGGKTDQFLIDKIQNNIVFLKKILPDLSKRPITNLKRSERLVVPNQQTLVDEASMWWVTENPHYLFGVDSHEDSLLIYDEENYGASKIVETTFYESTDLYENGVVHGFLLSLILAVKKIRDKLSNAHARPIENAFHLDGYVSFFSQVRKFSVAINANKIIACDHMLKDLHGLRAWFESKVIVSKLHMGVPYFTQKAKRNFLYHQVFSRFISWHRYGNPDWGVQDELNSIKDIPRLFEYYVLCVIKSQLGEMTLKGVPLTPVAISEEGDLFEYKSGNSTVKLMYEPEIWVSEHDKASSEGLVNTEGWTKNYKFNVQGGSGVFYKERSKNGRYSQRRPDFMIEVCSANAEPTYIIIDAKYTDSERAFQTYLPDLTMKYIHGIHHKKTGVNRSRALMIINPAHEGVTRHFHNKNYDIYSDSPVSPALLVTSIDVSKAHALVSNLSSDLSQLLLMSA